jgi:hypothetical protein
LAVRRKTVSDLPQHKRKLIFMLLYRENMYVRVQDYGLKSLWGIRIPVGLYQDMFGPIQILERTLAVRGSIFILVVKLESELKANPPDLRTPNLHLWRHYSMDRSFETADF